MINWNDTYQNRDFQSLNTANLTWVLSNVIHKINSNALDVGCGTGQLSRDLYHRDYQVLGVDLSENAIELAKNSTHYLGEALEFRVANIEADLELNENYDLIMCKYVYAFLQDKAAFLSKMKTLMSTDSLFVIITPDEEALPPPKRHIAVNHLETLKQLSSMFQNVSHENRDGDYYYLIRL